MWLVGWFVVFNATFNNISAKSWQSVLLVKETYYNLLTFTSRLYFSKFSMRKSQLMPHFNFVVMHNTHCQ
jgi:hypothetical protein